MNFLGGLLITYVSESCHIEVLFLFCCFAGFKRWKILDMD